MAEVQEVSPEHGHFEWETPLYRTALAQYEQALPHADVEEFAAALDASVASASHVPRSARCCYASS